MKRLLMLAMAAFMLTACGVKEGSEKETVSVQNKIPDTPKEKIEYALKKNRFADVIEIKGQLEEEPYSVQVEYQGKENLSSEELTVKTLKLAVVEAVYAMKEQDVDIENLKVDLKFPLTDKFGNTKDDYVIKSEFSSNTIEQLNADKANFKEDNLPDIADSWWAHPSIK